MSSLAASRLLLRAGVVLFLLGLLTGFVIPVTTNPRMGLASHLEGVLNGMFLIGLGLLWPRLSLTAWQIRVAVGLALFGTFANWLATLVAAVTGAGAMMPLAGGQTGEVGPELVITGLLMSLSIAMVLVCIFVLWGLRGTDTQTCGASPPVASRDKMQGR